MSAPSTITAVRKLFTFITFQEKLKWVKIVGFALCNSAMELFTASVVVIFAQVLNQPESGSKYMVKLGLGESFSTSQIILFMAVVFGVTYFLKNLIAIAEVFYQNFSIQKMSYHFKNKLLLRLSQADYNFYLTRNSSYGLAVVGSDAEAAFTSGMVGLSGIISEGVVFSALLVMIVYLNPSLAIFIFSFSVFIAVFVRKFLFPLFYRWGLRLQETSLLAHQNLLQFFHGFKEMILLGKREAFIDGYQNYSYSKSRIQAKQTATNAMPRIVLELIFVILFVATISYLSLENDTAQQMIGILGGYLYLGFRLLPGVNRIVNQLNAFKAIIPSIERVYKEITSDATNITYADVPDLQFRENITLKGVNFRYLNTIKNALENVNLVIQKGECVGIVGETGSGKSTLVDLILGLLQPQDGSILIDGKYPVRSIQWHKLIGYVPQSIYLIDDTIEKNIAFGEVAESIDQKRLFQAIDAAQLTTFINKLPEGAKTIVGERGILLSGGERQRISIARALYRNPEVLIFDEATAALDNTTEAKLMETIHAVSKDRTIIMIAHRLTTLRDCGRLLKVEGGCLTHIDLNA